METFLLLFIALAGVSGVRSQERLVQSSDPVVIKPGNSHTLSCEGFGFTFSSYWMAGSDRRLIEGYSGWVRLNLMGAAPTMKILLKDDSQSPEITVKTWYI
ncbi:unnamed protein product [Ranitomeya imitator]|uniref:Immunoglobulin V-set domain-containing protein n=1 Tax=Ranitomeya imitator TaxID=111125 RepID=A0ABN9L496_9NEOB|nr:unnamed protein product [Ranitomeya imitator]